MLQVIGKTVGSKFTFDLVARSAGSPAIRAPALDHKALDHPMEDQAVIKALLYKTDKVIDRVGSHMGIEFDPDLIHVLHGNGYDWVLHI